MLFSCPTRRNTCESCVLLQKRFSVVGRATDLPPASHLEAKAGVGRLDLGVEDVGQESIRPAIVAIDQFNFRLENEVGGQRATLVSENRARPPVEPVHGSKTRTRMRAPPTEHSVFVR